MDEPAAKVQISLRVPAELVAAYDTMAKAMERDRSWMMLRALKQYLESEVGSYTVAEAEGLAALDRGVGVDFDTVMDEADRIIAEAEARLARKAG